MSFISIQGKVYREVGIDEISMLDLMRFDAELAAAGLPYRWRDVERIGGEIADLDETAAGQHPDAMFMMATTVWLALRTAGEDLTLVDAARIPLGQIEMVADPQDHKKAGPTKRAAKKAAPKALPQASAAAE